MRCSCESAAGRQRGGRRQGPTLDVTYDRETDSFRAWLRTVTYNKWRDRLKARANRPLPGNDAALEAHADSDQFVELSAEKCGYNGCHGAQERAG
jgi:hypothetical protein